jgi:hypothetical protein
MLIAGLFAAGSAVADDAAPAPWIAEGAVSAGGMGTSRSGQDPSKLQEYQDLDSGMLSNIYVRGRDDKNWVDFYGENFGRDDMFITLRGGRYDTFKYNITTNWLPHDFVQQARTPFQGAGTALLTATFPQPNSATWNTLNIGYERKDTHGFVEWQANNPWYARVDGGQLTFNGTQPKSGANGTSPGNGFMDLVAPVHYTTNSASGEVGYSSTTQHFALNYLYSRFDNGDPSLRWTNPFFGNNLDTTYFASDNTYQRIGANGTIRQLPLNSTFAARYTWSKTSNDTGVPGQALNAGTGGNGTGQYVATMPNTDQFHGEFVDQTFSASVASTPAKGVDTHVYYNWHKLDNNSTQLVFAAGTPVDCSGPCDSTLYSYRKNNIGLDGIWRFSPGNRLAGGYDYLDTHQNRIDYDDVRYNKLWAEYKNTQMDTLSLRFRYQYLQRRSDFLLSNAGTGPNDPEYLNRFISRFDNADMNQNYFKFVGDWTPAPLWDASVEATLKKNEYPGTVLGRTRDTRYELFGNLSFGDFATMRVTFMADYEWVKYDAFHRNISDLAAPTAYDPNSAPTSSNYNWSSKNKDDNWLVGVGLDWQAAEKILVKGSISYFKSDGSANVDSQNNYGNPLPIQAFDDWKQAQVNLKAIYTFSKRWSFTAGYAYDKVEYSDIAYDGYQYTIPSPGVTNNPQQSYLSGYRAFPNSSVNIFYVLATMHF